MARAFFDNMTFIYSEEDNVYEPREDTYLLGRVLARLLSAEKFKKILDVGTGCGILACIAKKYCPEAKVVGVDIFENAINVAKANAAKNNLEIEFYVSDLFEKIPEGQKFDLIIFNAPYLKGEEEDKNIKGHELWLDQDVIIRFLKGLRKYLELEGKALLLLSSLTDDEVFNRMKKNFKTKLLAQQKLPWEELYVFEISMI